MKLRLSYHSPTAELKIWWQPSALDRWASDQPASRHLSRNLYFCLKLKHQQIQGDRHKFNQLQQLVSHSTHQLLAQSQTSTWHHTLNLDRLTTLKLSTLELFDLQNSLEQVEEDLELLPIRTSSKLSIWLKSSIAIATGITLGVFLSPRPTPPPPTPPVVLAPPPSPTTQRPTLQRLPSFLGRTPKFPTGRPIRIIARPPAFPEPPTVTPIPKPPVFEPPPPPTAPVPPPQPKTETPPEPPKPKLPLPPPGSPAPPPPPKPKLLITSRVQFSNQDLSKDQTIDLSFSLSQHLRRNVIIETSSKGEVEFEVNLQNGQITQVQFDQSNLSDRQLEQAISSAISSWQPPSNSSGTARLIIRLW